MTDEQKLSEAIGVSVGMYPKEIADMLIRNKVYAPAPNYTTSQLVKGVFIGLNQNPSFTKEYANYMEQIKTTLNL